MLRLIPERTSGSALVWHTLEGTTTFAAARKPYTSQRDSSITYTVLALANLDAMVVHRERVAGADVPLSDLLLTLATPAILCDNLPCQTLS